MILNFKIDMLITGQGTTYFKIPYRYSVQHVHVLFYTLNDGRELQKGCNSKYIAEEW